MEVCLHFHCLETRISSSATDLVHMNVSVRENSRALFRNFRTRTWHIGELLAIILASYHDILALSHTQTRRLKR